MKWIFKHHRQRWAGYALAGLAGLIGTTGVLQAQSPDASQSAPIATIESTSSPTTANVATESEIDGRSRSAERVEFAERSITEIRKETRTKLKEEAKATKGTQTHRQVIGDLIHLHTEAVAHSSFKDRFALRETRAQIQSRLVRIERDIRETFHAPRTPKPAHVAAQQPLAQFPGVNPINPAGGFGQGAGQQGAGQPGIAGQLPDYGPQLAELIQSVIDPLTWDVNGGPGSIIYFPPLKALVVSAPGEVHHNVAELLGQMRAAQ